MCHFTQWTFSDFTTQALRDDLRMVQIGFGQQHRKFFTTDPSEHVARSLALTGKIGHVHDRAVQTFVEIGDVSAAVRKTGSVHADRSRLQLCQDHRQKDELQLRHASQSEAEWRLGCSSSFAYEGRRRVRIVSKMIS